MTVRINNDWDYLLKDEWDKEYYQKLRLILYNEYLKYKIHPDKEDIFNALKSVSYEDCKLVILGQDPYHGIDQAHGYSFSVKKGIKIPPSLMNIYKELKDDLGCFIPNNGYLLKWANQGVLLLNSTLTVRENMANSHRNIGWTILTDRIIEILGRREKPIVFILWGNYARSKKNLIENKKHLILESPHPSPLSASRGFFGSRPFSKVNKFLKDNNIEEIDWQIENI